ncbi:flavin reductase family protein [Mobilicoccus massiliensis]|uniref:flavin reductase family protein n=1 Tax=Mobilicoccus massiliensis TaxID=1522310 RepID=UPI000590B0D7|nr:flavin reductase family protein [Mobilicoccus massiliensis]
MSDLGQRNAPNGDDLRAVMTNFAAGVAVATTRLGEVDHAITVNSFTSVSLDPPLVLLCVGRASRFVEPVRLSGNWGISILAADAGPLARRLATRGGPPAPVLQGIPHHRGVTGVALLDEALATLECTTTAIHPGGDHDIIVGAVVSTSVGPASGANVPAPGTIDDRGPLVSFRGAFGTTT